jgi:hypothetical protein
MSGESAAAAGTAVAIIATGARARDTYIEKLIARTPGEDLRRKLAFWP